MDPSFKQAHMDPSSGHAQMDHSPKQAHMDLSYDQAHKNPQSEQSQMDPSHMDYQPDHTLIDCLSEETLIDCLPVQTSRDPIPVLIYIDCLCEPIRKRLAWWRRKSGEAQAWYSAKQGELKRWYSSNKKLLLVVATFWKLLGISSYSGDIYTDCRTSKHHYENGDYVWSGITATLIVLPVLFSDFWFIVVVVAPKSDYPLLLTISALIFAPVVPCCILIWDLLLTVWYLIILVRDPANIVARAAADVIANNHPEPTEYSEFDADDNRNIPDVDVGAGVTKLSEASVESYPQAGLQMYIVTRHLKEGKDIENLQWLTIAVSIVNLAFTVSRSAIFEGSTFGTKIICFLLGIMSVVSRLLVCCSYSWNTKQLFFLPLATYFVFSTILWMITNYCHHSHISPHVEGVSNRQPSPIQRVVSTLHSNFHLGHDAPFISCFGTAAYNSFTLSGLVVSVLNLGFAVGGCFLDIQHTVIIYTTLSLAVLSCFFNLIIVTVPSDRSEDIRKQWLNIRKNSEVRDIDGTLQSYKSWFY